ncbi:hypothetical protein V502_04730 [Pseudogymnoascus sp. VKM F-4520 (FW-2644)]|nr:hypothetical protein V502_04730 [Pseudogymnoascus sp. VKM F-4520 (FW-2644)]
MAFGYDADVVRPLFGMASSNVLSSHGMALAMDLSRKRFTSNSNQRPIVFVAHSLGGLVVEQALVHSRRSSEQNLEDIFNSTAAIAFLGTPHAGSNKATWAAPVTLLSSVFFRKTNRRIVQLLEIDSEVLANLRQEFHSILHDERRAAKRIAICCFYEELAVFGIGKIVPKWSAVLDGYLSCGIHANHSNMTRYNGPHDTGYVRVRDQLLVWTRDLQTQIQDADGTTETQPAETQHAVRPGIRLGGAASQSNQPPISETSGSIYSGTVNSAGGPVFQGNQTVAGDWTLNFGKLN